MSYPPRRRMTIVGVSPALAARDRTPPTRPTNLRVTSTSAYYVSLAWNPSTDNSGTFSYKVWVSYGQIYTVSQTQTTFTLFLVPENTYSFYVYAVDGSGNKSSKSNTVSATLLADTTPPTAPVLSLVDVNPTEVSLQWTASTDDGPYLFYQLFVNGSPNVDTGTSRSAVVQGLTPETSYTFTVKARDLYGHNVSAPSNAITVTTDPSNPNDTEPPTTPGNLSGSDMGCAEVSYDPLRHHRWRKHVHRHCNRRLRQPVGDRHLHDHPRSLLVLDLIKRGFPPLPI